MERRQKGSLMKHIFGVEDYNKQEDFDRAIAMLVDLGSQGDEGEIVYIEKDNHMSMKARPVLARLDFILRDRTASMFESSLQFNTKLLQEAGIKFTIAAKKEMMIGDEKWILKGLPSKSSKKE